MKKWLTSAFLLFAFASGALAGLPTHTEQMRDSQMTMKCCKKDDGNSPKADAARLCCTLVCTDAAPTSSGFSFNFPPSAVIVSDSIAKQIAALFGFKKTVPSALISFERENFSQKTQPKFIQHHSFLI